MTPRELNRDIKRLAKRARDSKNLPYETEEEKKKYHAEEGLIKEEAKRLYYADRKFKYMNKESLKILLRLNVRYRFEAFHHFGLQIEL